MKRVGVLISGRGSNLQSLIDAATRPGYPARIACVISNRPDAAGLDRARRAGIPAETIDHKPFGKDREAFERALDARLAAHGVELVALAGFMRLFTPFMIERWQGRMINIHPALLPAFKGLDTHRRALEAGVKIAGCTVHFVTLGMDEGPIIAQAAVAVLAGDDEASLAARVLAAEHRIYPWALELVASGRVRLVGDRAEYDRRDGSDAMLISPAPDQAKST
ncbi:MAG: phosphoribosylglycinamide formyltransferase [Alphaproteobacteria bacterium]|nr:phosphoribosylglycinamide formyltransferase [Alphaproteobacteria bacterium]